MTAFRVQSFDSIKQIYKSCSRRRNLNSFSLFQNKSNIQIGDSNTQNVHQNSGEVSLNLEEIIEQLRHIIGNTSQITVIQKHQSLLALEDVANVENLKKNRMLPLQTLKNVYGELSNAVSLLHGITNLI